MTTIAPHLARTFLFAGHARFALVNPISGARIEIELLLKKNSRTGKELHFAYSAGHYLGYVPMGSSGAFPRLFTGQNGDAYHPASRALQWLLDHLVDPQRSYAPAEIHHLGYCCRCGRALSDEVSLATGFGPECSKLLKIKRVAPDPTLPPNDAINAQELFRAINGDTKTFPFRTIAECKAYVHKMTDEGLLTVDESIETNREAAS